MIFKSKSEEDTLKIGKEIAALLIGGDILSLVGNLGAGKTVLTRGISDSLGIKKGVKSPTFTLMNIYSTNNKQGIKFICHIDAYRLNKAQDLLNIGAQDYFSDPEVLTIIEWGDKAKDILPRRAKTITIETTSESDRKIKFGK
ncbi:MAG: tRNA (adenosine(37)-N6)-threonylcarbamoyltransferase complex ATPase subunit type 1 TsaE [Candidatus Falkowbacteria bacterium]|nr:tRNA (adenosine(37)-N6)-threonylcarbamoyltransferase complex ATPase subunit type 1 TsaE [Candidatus Falkowbacteria bacterium]